MTYYTIFSLDPLSDSEDLVRETISRFLLFWFSLLAQTTHMRTVITVKGTATTQYIQILGDATREDVSLLSLLVPGQENMSMLNKVATKVAGR